MERIIGFLKERKKLVLIILLILVAFILVISSGTKNADADSTEESLSEYKKELEEELSELCSRVDGAGKCYVTLTLERGEQKSYKGSQLTETKPPRVLGVTVVCRGAESDRVRSDLTEMMCALFDIGSNRVAVLKLS